MSRPVTQDQKKVLESLRPGPLNQFEIADATGLPPFTVRGELHALRRERLVRDTLNRDQHIWTLTDNGYACAWGEHQEQIA